MSDMNAQGRDGGDHYRRALFTDVLFFVLMVVAIVLAVVYKDYSIMVLALPIVLITASALFFDRIKVRLPPMMMSLLVVSFYLSAMARSWGEGDILELISFFITGINLGLLGLVIIYMLMRSMPGVRDGAPKLVVFVTMSVAISVFALMNLFQFLLSEVLDDVQPMSYGLQFYGMIAIIVGSTALCVLYMMFPDSKLFKYTVSDFLTTNSDMLGLEGAESDNIHRIIEAGESDQVEFKSTIRTNLETGEIDKRMEKAVLKTLVAFMNTDGGTLLIGVADDGEIRGLDIQSFENADKLNLHLTNMISSGIGNGLLPFINFKLVDFGDNRYVMRVVCKPSSKPVFLKEGKLEIFYVRSGPSSVELTGMSLVRYINNMSKKGKRSYQE